MSQTATAPTIPTQDFTGKPNDPTRVFFAPPPPEIGEVSAGESTLKQGRAPMSAAVRIGILAASALPGVILCFYRNDNIVANGPDAWLPWCMVGGILIAVGLLIAWFSTRFKVSCAYVGSTGAVRYTLNGSLQKPPRAELVDFNRAAELRTRQTRNYLNGAYTGTEYHYQWVDFGGKDVLTLKGTYRSAKGTPARGHPFYFATAAEIMWSKFQLARMDQELEEKGFLTFRLNANDAVILGPGFIEFNFGGKQARCEAGDIRSIDLAQGTFAIIHKDKKWYSSKGRFSFQYGQMPNARLFLLALDRFLPASTLAGNT